MQLSVAAESNRVFMFESPMLALYIDVCTSLICIDSISVGLTGSVASAWLFLGDHWTGLV